MYVFHFPHSLPLLGNFSDNDQTQIIYIVYNNGSLIFIEPPTKFMFYFFTFQRVKAKKRERFGYTEIYEILEITPF